MKELGAQVQSLESEIERIERELRRLAALQGREATLSKSLQEAQEAASKLGEQQQVVLALRRQLEEGQYATREREQLATVEASILRLGYDKMAHDQAREAVISLASFDNEKAELERAQQAIAELRASQQRLGNDRQNWAAALQIDEQRLAELQAGLAGVEELAPKLQANEREVDELRRQEGHARQVLGATQQKLDYCAYLARERQERAKQLDELAEERGLYEELRTAFGKKGLQALIIESVIPELEDEATALLRRMTEGRMSLHFETQRDTKSGSVMETLEIKISDECGPRSYEMYSGGEAFRINFAIRIALSKLLARRVGAQLQTLIIDEGFGTQDADGRQRLVEAINSIKDDFVRIIVITHIDELKDAFPVRIDVYKTPQGSQIALS
jgi:exonuclease SbcC